LNQSVLIIEGIVLLKETTEAFDVYGLFNISCVTDTYCNVYKPTPHVCFVGRVLYSES